MQFVFGNPTTGENENDYYGKVGIFTKGKANKTAKYHFGKKTKNNVKSNKGSKAMAKKPKPKSKANSKVKKRLRTFVSKVVGKKVKGKLTGKYRPNPAPYRTAAQYRAEKEKLAGPSQMGKLYFGSQESKLANTSKSSLAKIKAKYDQAKIKAQKKAEQIKQKMAKLRDKAGSIAQKKAAQKMKKLQEKNAKAQLNAIQRAKTKEIKDMFKSIGAKVPKGLLPKSRKNKNKGGVKMAKKNKKNKKGGSRAGQFLPITKKKFLKLKAKGSRKFSTMTGAGKKRHSVKGVVRRLNNPAMSYAQSGLNNMFEVATQHSIIGAVELAGGGALYGLVNRILAGNKFTRGIHSSLQKVPVIGPSLPTLVAGVILNVVADKFSDKLGKSADYIQSIGKGLVGASVVAIGVSASQKIPGLSGVDFTLEGDMQLGGDYQLGLNEADFGSTADFGELIEYNDQALSGVDYTMEGVDYTAMGDADIDVADFGELPELNEQALSGQMG